MIKQQYAVLDITANVFLNALTFTNNADAIRWFTTVVNSKDEKSNISKYPGQFTLFRLADYDDQTGEFKPRENDPDNTAMKPKELINGAQCVEEQEIQYTVKQLIQMLKSEIKDENVIDLEENWGVIKNGL
jgi:hypothetical protein